MNDDEKRFLEQIQKENESAHAETRRLVQSMAADMERMQTQNEDAHSETRRQVQAMAADMERMQAQNEDAHSRRGDRCRLWQPTWSACRHRTKTRTPRRG